jgi:phosphoenolpyruvate synthase/pyruvate phosphate dikinase
VPPKVILVHNYGDALKIYEKYKDYILAVISDTRYLNNGKVDCEAGVKLISKVKENKYNIPTILLSELRKNLNIFLDYIKYPIAVRSSGLLEDSYSEPFAGIYRTYMLPNNHPDKELRLQQLSDAIKLVFASVFIKNAKNYIQNLSH